MDEETAATDDKTVVDLTTYLEHRRVLWDPYDHNCKETSWRTSSCFVAIARRTCRKPKPERETYTPRPYDTSKHAAPTGRCSHADTRTYTTRPIHRSAAGDLNTNLHPARQQENAAGAHAPALSSLGRACSCDCKSQLSLHAHAFHSILPTQLPIFHD